MIVNILGMWFRGLLSLLIIGAGVYSLYRWHEDLPRSRPVVVSQGPEPRIESQPLTTFSDRVAAWRPGWDGPTAFLSAGLGLLLMSVAGRFVTPRSWLRSGNGEPRQERGGEVRTIRRPDGTVLHVELYGPPHAPPLVLTHGWGGDATEWYYIKKDLAADFRIIAWDLPGLGLSTEPENRDYSLEKMARDLDAVLSLAEGQPAVLVGHSIGGMTMLTWAKLFPEGMPERVAGMVLVHTTDVNPVHTKVPTWLLPMIQKPILEPACHATVALSPLFRMIAYLSYQNGSVDWSNHRSIFAGTETREQLAFASRYVLKASPAVLARGTLGMFRYDATAVLRTIRVPVLVVAAGGDRTTIPEASQRMAREIPGAQLVTLAPARHMGLLERHTEFSNALRTFCQAVASRPVGV